MAREAASRASLKNVSVEDVGHAARELDELFQCWADRLTLNNLRFAERYLKGEIHVCIWFEQIEKSYISDKARQFRAIINGTDAVSGREDQAGALLPRLEAKEIGSCQDVHMLVRGPYRHDGLVLIERVELVDDPEGFAPAFVWFEAVDEPSHLLSGSVYFTRASGFKLFRLRAIGNPCPVRTCFLLARTALQMM